MAMPSGTHIVVELQLGDAAWIEQRAHILRSDAPGHPFAIAFDDLSPEVEAMIADQVRAAGDLDRSPRVLVVDCADARRHRLSATLRRAGALPIEARTPLEAIEQLVDAPRSFTAVVIAEVLTQTGGAELVQYLAATHPGLHLAIVRERAEPPPMEPGELVVIEDDDCDRSGPVRMLLDDPV
jgi:hypothetical protein